MTLLIRSAEKESINRVVFSLVALQCSPVARKFWKKNFTKSQTGRAYNSLGLGGELVSTGLTMHWFLISSPIKEAAFSTVLPDYL